MARSETGNTADPAMSDAPVDLAALARLMGRSDPVLINQMLAMFWQAEAETPLMLRRLTLARDSDGLAGAAHGAKGAASSVGATKVADLCKALECCAKSDDWEAVAALTAEVEQAYSEVGAFIARTRH
jgi:HPt (histidine-containing phosphotransfer) domain-containing protein